MEFLGLSNLILILVTVAIVFAVWSSFRNVCKKKKISIYIYFLLLGIVPGVSFFIMYRLITIPHIDFFGYIFVILFTCCIFASVWIFTALNGEYKKVELSMYIVISVILLLFMMSMGIIEILPNSILELFLKPVVSIGIFYDIWNRPSYQLAHLVTYIITFPYIASFVIGKGILIFRRQKDLSNI